MLQFLVAHIKIKVGRIIIKNVNFDTIHPEHLYYRL